MVGGEGGWPLGKKLKMGDSGKKGKGEEKLRKIK